VAAANQSFTYLEEVPRREFLSARMIFMRASPISATILASLVMASMPVSSLDAANVDRGPHRIVCAPVEAEAIFLVGSQGAFALVSSQKCGE
jgi:hypothetical protein